jgi:hypothetical protein
VLFICFDAFSFKHVFPFWCNAATAIFYASSCCSVLSYRSRYFGRTWSFTSGSSINCRGKPFSWVCLLTRAYYRQAVWCRTWSALHEAKDRICSLIVKETPGWRNWWVRIQILC